MRFGVKLGVDVPSDPDELHQLVTAVDEFGYDSIWVGDHVVIPRTIDGRAHESQVGGGVGFADKQHSDVLDPIVALTFIASLAPRLRIGLSVLVIPYRDPVVCAKMLATLDVLSGGRLIVGAGVGWMREEFDALGVPFETRGELTDRHLAAMIELWSNDLPGFDGELSRLDGVSFLPKPRQRPHMPVWIGGNRGPAMRRAARLGQGWMPNFQTPDELGPKLDRLHALAEANGRRLADLTIAVGCRVAPGSSRESAISRRSPAPKMRCVTRSADLRRSESTSWSSSVLATSHSPNASRRWSDSPPRSSTTRTRRSSNDQHRNDERRQSGRNDTRHARGDRR
jgi:probable F420-dependent oxidoreductase